MAVTTLGTIALLPFPGLLTVLQRSPAIVEGHEIWRLFTAFLTLGDNTSQISFNLAGLAVIGMLVEWRAGRVPWLAAYFAGGLTGELFGLAWKPFGAGNSVAVMGLLGLLLVTVVRRAGATWPQRLVWPLVGVGMAGALCYLRDIHGPPVFVGAAAGYAVVRWRRA